MRTKVLLIIGALVALSLCTPLQAQERGGERGRPQQNSDDNTRLNKTRISGTVESIEGDNAMIRTSRGRLIRVNLGPRSFWRERGYHLEPGIRVTVRGWRRPHDDAAPFFAAGIWGPGFHFELSNGAGFPEWVDPDDYRVGWYPTVGFYQRYYFGPPAVVEAPPPWWHHDPTWWKHHRPRRNEGHEQHGQERHGGRGR